MRVLKWLFHPVYLLVIIIAAAVYLNRDVLQQRGSSAPAVASTVQSAEATAGSSTPQSVPALAGSGDAAAPEAGDGAAAPPGTRDKAAQGDGQPVTESAAPGDNTTTSQGAAEAGAATSTSVPSVPVTAPAVKTPADTAATAGAEASAGEPIPKPSETAKAIWHNARLAAWEGHFEDSLASYQQLVRQIPSNPDAYGEMGNVYLELGDWRKAVDAYYQAALNAQAAGDMQRAWQVQRIIAGFDWNRAEKLGKKLSATDGWPPERY